MCAQQCQRLSQLLYNVTGATLSLNNYAVPGLTTPAQLHSSHQRQVQDGRRLTSQMALYICLSAFCPHWLSKLNSLNDGPAVPALLSPCRQIQGLSKCACNLSWHIGMLGKCGNCAF